MDEAFGRQVRANEKVGLLGVLPVGSVGNAVEHGRRFQSQVGVKRTQQIAERNERQARENQVFDDSRAQHAAQADELYNEHQSHQRFTLRKRLLQPGEQLTGFVYFPRTNAASHLRVVVYLRERPFAFDFNQARLQH